MTGKLLVHKPIGLPSFSIVKKLRKILGISRIGFAGTLDPFASGLLVMGIGRTHTRTLDNILALPKTYEVTSVFGIQTNTQDSFGIMTQTSPASIQSEELISQAIGCFLGQQIQTPPMFSAKKKQGVPLYRLARKGIDCERKDQTIYVHAIQLKKSRLDLKYPICDFEITCSKGTYIRTLIEDIGKKLGTTAYTKDLTRTRIGPYCLNDALTIDQLTPITIESNLIHD